MNNYTRKARKKATERRAKATRKKTPPRPLKGGSARSEAGASAPALGNTRTGFPVRSNRSDKQEFRDDLQSFTSNERVRKCGRVPVSSGVELRLNTVENVAGYRGLHTCGSVWLCPVCSAKISAFRRDEIAEAIKYAEENGLVTSLLTLTMRHNSRQKLEDLWRSLSTAWNSVTSGRPWLTFKDQLGFEGFIRAAEVTYGKSGWHVHLHVLIFSEKDPDKVILRFQRKQGNRKEPYEPEFKKPLEFMQERWLTALGKVGLTATKARGVDWVVAKNAKDAKKIGVYIAKSPSEKLSEEIAFGNFKKAFKKNRTPFQILSDIIEKGEKKDLALWYEYERASHGKRALTWSKGLRDKVFASKEELTDEEVAELEMDGEQIALFNNSQWREFRRAIEPWVILDLLEQRSAKAVYEVLDSLGLAYYKAVEKKE